jgi:hypothetical protein
MLLPLVREEFEFVETERVLSASLGTGGFGHDDKKKRFSGNGWYRNAGYAGSGACW